MKRYLSAYGTRYRFAYGQAALSAEMAIRVDKAFGADVRTLLRTQATVDIARAKARAPEIDVTPYEPA